MVKYHSYVDTKPVSVGLILQPREVKMDGFRERLSGRYDRSQARGGYERTASDDRYENERYERPSRRNTAEGGISQEALNETIAKSNREQLDVIADFFDEAKADRMESERAIIDAFTHGMNELSVKAGSRTEQSEAPAAPIAVVDEQNAETLARIERISGQNAETLNENGEILGRSIDTLRANSEVLNEIRTTMGQILSSSEEVKNASGQLQESIRQSIGEISGQASPMQDLTIDFTEEKNEIIGAVGDNRAILNMIRQDVLNGFARNSESEDEQEEKAAPFSAEDADRYYKELEDHVHKECVKCYRNVQQALTEQSSEANAAVLKSVSGMRIMVLIGMIFGIIGGITGILSLLINLGLIVL